MVELIFRDNVCLNQEDENFEAKSFSRGIPESLWESYSAFANTSGGTIVLGLDETDRGLVVGGVSNAYGIRDDLWSTLNNPQKVSVNVLVGNDLRVVEHGGKELIVMDVCAADRTLRPVYIRNVNSGTYKRNGTGDYHCNAAEIASMYRDASPDSHDVLTSRLAGMDDLNPDSIEAYRNMMSSVSPTSEWLTQSKDEFLRLIGAARTEDGVLKPTLAGLMMFGEDYAISAEIPGFSLDYREYEDGGDEWTLRRLSGTPNWSGNLFDFYIFVTNRIQLQVGTGFKVPDGMNRVDDTTLVRALREIVSNAVLHADYWGRGGIVIEVRPDRFTARNPGTFRIPIDEAESGGLSDPRNRALFKMLGLIGRAERAGSGVRSVMLSCEALGLGRPDIRESQRPDTVTVTVNLKATEESGMEGRVLRIIGDDPKTTMEEMSEALGISRSAVVSLLGKLRDDGRVRRVGGPRGRWEVVKGV